MLESMYNAFQHHTLLHRLGERFAFFALGMIGRETMQSIINRVQNFGSVVQSMRGTLNATKLQSAQLMGFQVNMTACPQPRMGWETKDLPFQGMGRDSFYRMNVREKGSV